MASPERCAHCGQLIRVKPSRQLDEKMRAWWSDLEGRGRGDDARNLMKLYRAGQVSAPEVIAQLSEWMGFPVEKFQPELMPDDTP